MSSLYRTLFFESERAEAKNRLVLEIAAEGRPTVAYIPVTILGK